MKKLSIILISALVAFAACTKSKEVHPELGDGNDEIVTVGMKDVHVEYTRTDHEDLQKVVFHYCLAETQQFEAAEMTKKETFFELTLNDLYSDTLYYYYYELFPIGGNAYQSEQKTFHTQAFDTPEPPEPPTPPSAAPEGAINGLFTVNANGDQVYFSQGNLQYQASTNTWRFAEYQWNCVGGRDFQGEEYGNVYENGVKCDNNEISSTYSGWIDLFGWGTSGCNHGANCYQPWCSSTNYDDYWAYGSSTYNLYDQTGNADWGYNVISNGLNAGNNSWRTLTTQEWEYVFNTRTTTSGIRYAKGIINDIKGIIMLPDNWSASIYMFDDTNEPTAEYNNVISATDWVNVIEANGGVFLPVTFGRWGTSVNNRQAAFYWSASYYDDESSLCLRFECIGGIDLNCSTYRNLGASVRLVQDAQ